MRMQRVGYVLKKFPRLSETFILNEILGLEQAGVEVVVHSLRLPDDGKFHGRLGELRSEVCYTPPYTSRNVYDTIKELNGLPPYDSAGLFGLLDLLPEAKRAPMLVQAVELARHVRRHRLDHLHAHFMTIAAHTAALAHFLTGVPFSVTAHAKDIFRETVDAAIFRAVAEAASRIVTVTDFNERYIREHFLQGSSCEIARIYNGIPLPNPQPRTPPAPLILGVGRLVEKKGFHVLLEACRQLAEEGTRFDVEIIGGGEERKHLEARTKSLGLSDRVSFLGPQPSEFVAARMRAARILAAPCVTATDGNRDALPTVLVEAIATGLPCVATRLNGIPEIIEGGREGLIVEEGDVPALSRGMRTLLSNDALWRRFSEAGYRKAARRFDIAATLPQLIDVFDGTRCRLGAVV